MTKRPSNLTAVCAASIIFAALDLFGAMSGCATLAIGSERMLSMVKRNDSLGDVQVRMNKELAEVNEAWKPFSIVQVIVKFGLGSALLIGAIAVLKVSRKGRRWLVRTLQAAVPIDLIVAVPAILLLARTKEISARYMSEMASKLPVGGGLFQSIMEGAQATAVVFGIALVLGRVAFYVYGARYLKSSEVDQAFAA